MPARRPLYLASDLGQLNERCEVKTAQARPEALLKSLDKLLASSQAAQGQGDQEQAYVLGMRSLEVIKAIRSHREYGRDRKYYDGMIGAARYEQLLLRCEELGLALDQRYQARRAETALPSAPIQKKSVAQPAPSPPPSRGVAEGLTAKALYRLMEQKATAFLLLDARPRSEFEASRIQHPHLIHVPAEILVPGVTAQGVMRGLRVEDRADWDRRLSVDCLILLDAESERVEPGSSLHHLRQALTQWDGAKDRYRCGSPVLLLGGHCDFVLHYPMRVTNPHRARAPRPATTRWTDLSALDYPDLDQAFIQTPSPGRTSPVECPSLDGQAWPSMPDRRAKPSVHFQPPPSQASTGSSDILASTGSSDILERGFLASEDSAEDGPPSIPDRSLKAKMLLAVGRGPQGRHHLKDLLDADQDLVEDSIQSEEKSLALERDWAMAKLHREREADEVMRGELQKKEELLLAELDQLHLESERKDEENRDLRQQLKALMAVQEQKLAQANIKADVEKKIQADIRLREAEEERLRREVERKRRERQERREADLGRRQAEQRRIETEERLEKERRVEAERRARDAAQKRQAVERALAEQLERKEAEEKEAEKRKTSDRYTMPLRDEPETPSNFGGSLNRSHSSPNIAQLMEDEDHRALNYPRPKIDRQAKPSPSFGGARNFQPVWSSSQKKGLTGLKNLGNTCYMNSVLQCLSNFALLAQFFMGTDFRRAINKKSRTRGEFAVEFSELIRALWSGQCKSIAPKDLKRTFGKYVASFQGTRQQDAHEFLSKLVESLHNDLNEIQGKFDPPEIDYDKMDETTGARKAWHLAKKMDKSFIHELFYGQMKSSLKCLQCGFESPKYETFFQLSLNLPLDNSKCTVRDCLQRYLEPEEVEWACPKCRRSGLNHKKLDIVKFPLILIIHLSRFYHDEYGMSGKKQNRVEFEMTDFSAGRYAQACGGSENPYVDYQLQAVCNHFGTLEGGHYTAYCYSQAYKGWYKYDDSDVTSMPASEVKSPAAYMLFYAARN